MTINSVLEVANVNNIIDRSALSMYLLWFLSVEFILPKEPFGSRIVDRDVQKYGTCLGSALLLWALGALVITGGVNLWRDQHLVIGVWLMAAGSTGTVVGNLLAIRILSVQRYGNWLWLTVLMMNMVYTVWALV